MILHAFFHSRNILLLFLPLHHLFWPLYGKRIGTAVLWSLKGPGDQCGQVLITVRVCKVTVIIILVSRRTTPFLLSTPPENHVVGAVKKEPRMVINQL